MKKRTVLKKTISAVCAGCLVLFSFPLPFGAASAKAKTTDYLNLRRGAGTNTNVILTISKNTTVTVLDNSDAQWAKVQTSDGKTGYCFKQYLSFSSGSTTTSGSAAVTAKTTDNLNLRQDSSLSGKILMVLAKGSSLTVLDNSNSSWVKVQTQNGAQGWCSRAYLTVSGAAAPPETNTSSSAATAKTTDYLNLRSGAGMSNKVLLTLSKGVSVTVLDNSNSDWVKVRTQNGTQGWCSRKYLTVTGGTNTGTNSSSSTPPSSSSALSSQSSSSQPSSSSSSSGSNGSGGTDTETNSGVSGIKGATVTADVLRLREQANTSCKVLSNLVNGTSLQVLGAPASGWVKVQTPDGKTGYVSTDYVKIIYSDGTSTGGSTDTNQGGGTNASSLSLSSGSQTVPAGKTLYLKASTSPSNADVSWSSSNTSVATVINGYVTAVSKGSAVITATSGTETATCGVTVSDAEPVRTAYASPNIAGPGETVTLTAITDSSRDGVRFYVTKPTGITSSIDAVSSTQETTNGVTTKVWKASATFSDPGNYTVLAQSRAGGVYTTAGFTTSAYITKQADKSVTSSEELRVSDEMIQLISKWEGYRACVYTDTIASSQIPTIGYGCTLAANAEFYNGVSETEAWSMMVNRINGSSYTSELNKMIRNNGFLMNQYQADCLISFAYNVGSGYFNSSTEMDFIKIMKNAVRPPDFSSGTTYEATVTENTQVRSNSGIMSAQNASVTAGTAVVVTGGDFSDKKDGWYQIKLTDGTVGWVNSGYVSLANSSRLVHDLAYTNAYAMGTELIRWNQAGGKFYTGLFYRRLGEVNVYNYGDYSAARYNKYGYGYPSAAASLQ
ncbi:Bacterial SH3 domain protein [Caprobacter fermentans]|uniref:Lysozyme n=1 Tax=Caproicibacter fermentans TaxID=2576756 RepID=A0A6N8I437_9FIRM|nr:SH3 domain-containing protein [Caproicibacter fermentans]MVB12370.1 Bacterial SH3 domain protein [Caproicibacter fermentans]